MSEVHFVVSPDKQSLFEDTARRIVDAARTAIQARGQFTIALSGGSTPKGLFQLLGSPEWKAQIDWSKVRVFWGDERYVPVTDPQSNYRMTYEALLKHVNIPPENVHRVMTEAGTPDEVAAAYEKTIRRVLNTPTGVPQLDYTLLGIGENGHTASLFPHQPVLHETKKLVAADYVKEVGMYRITMTLPLLNNSRVIAFLLSGSGKADVLRDVVAGPRQPEQLPSQLITPTNGQLFFLLDQAAAAKLPADVLASAAKPSAS